MRDIARQVTLQSPQLTAPGSAMEIDGENHFLDDLTGSDRHNDANLAGEIPPHTRLSSLISALPTLSRPVVVVLDAFEMFTSHARQALLYCLLDTVQSCRASGTGAEAGKSAKVKAKVLGGLAVVGLTPRVDVMNLLEKRVKSRFSHRIILTAGSSELKQWDDLLNVCLCVDANSPAEPMQRSRSKEAIKKDDSPTAQEEWKSVWFQSVQAFLQERPTREILRETFDLTRDLRVLIRIMVCTLHGIVRPTILTRVISDRRRIGSFTLITFPFFATFTSSRNSTA